MGKAENAGYQYFLHLTQCFRKRRSSSNFGLCDTELNPTKFNMI